MFHGHKRDKKCHHTHMYWNQIGVWRETLMLWFAHRTFVMASPIRAHCVETWINCKGELWTCYSHGPSWMDTPHTGTLQIFQLSASRSSTLFHSYQAPYSFCQNVLSTPSSQSPMPQNLMSQVVIIPLARMTLHDSSLSLSPLQSTPPCLPNPWNTPKKKTLYKPLRSQDRHKTMIKHISNIILMLPYILPID